MIVKCPTCPVCGKNELLAVDEVGYNRWQSGTYVQIAFPNMPADQREMLISGIHPECWKILFKKEEA